ncbi:hypothetical protein [Actinomycetospora sp. CA-084318]|uniref:hypothetical protein n=1 Tax=Actinomycetospora sp. CA-084318 TaxID=3239892 RepID=UPI003D98F8BA
MFAFTAVHLLIAQTGGVQLWASEPVGCSGLVVLAAADDRQVEDGFEPRSLPSTWLVDEATADRAVEMLQDAVATGHDVDIDHIVVRAAHATGGHLA